MDIDYSLYLVTDRSFLGSQSIEKAVEEAIKGGVTVVQLREKNLSTREFYNLGLRLKTITSYYKVPLFINDRVDIALAIDADGVHLGQSDMELNIARKILGKDKLIGISTENLSQAKQAELDGADYIGVGAVFYTSTKNDINKPIELEGLKEICSNIKIPKIAIGGININNLKEIFRAGADGAALVSAILDNENILEASNKLLKIIRE
jgi:thiamine-phosphate pyrophosphorylase